MSEQEESQDRKKQEAEDKKAVGGNIKEYRKKKRMTQENLAEEVGENVSNKTISRYEKGGNHMSMCTFLTIAEKLGVTPNDLSPARLLVNRKEPPPEYYALSDQNRVVADDFIRALKLKQDTTG